MNMIALIAVYGFFIGLKRASRLDGQGDTTAVGFIICLLLALIQIAMVGCGTGFTFWAVTVCVFVSTFSMTMALSTPKMWMDVVAIIFFTLSLAMMGIDLMALIIGGMIALFVFPIAFNYKFKGWWLENSRTNTVKAIALFGLVAVWWVMGRFVRFNIYSIIRFFTD